MAHSSGRDLAQFERWYSQSGTPQLKVQSHYDAAKQTYELTLSQSCKPGAGQKNTLPFHIPVAVGLLDAGAATCCCILTMLLVIRLRLSKNPFALSLSKCGWMLVLRQAQHERESRSNRAGSINLPPPACWS